MRAAVAHLHAFVAEVGLTRDEWFAAVDFLHPVGQMCDGQRQEVILLERHARGCRCWSRCSTTPGRPARPSRRRSVRSTSTARPSARCGASIVDDRAAGARARSPSGSGAGPGRPARAGGPPRRVADRAQGLYDVQDPTQPEMNLRGMFTTGEDGAYSFRTVRPVAYPIPEDGPVGEMLRASGRHNWRPAHIHFLVSAPGHKPVITHVFDRASRYLDEDAVFGVRPSLILDMEGGTATFDPVLERVGAP